MTLLLIVSFSLLGGLVSVLFASTILVFRREALGWAMPRLVSFSTGTLLGAALLGMLPHASRTLPMAALSEALLAGLLAFFVLEKLLVWRHCHKSDCDVHATSGSMLLVGDAFHNLVDGVVIAAAFLESVPLGIAAGLSTIAHEVPQELGEFMVYLKDGYSRRKALALNGATSLTGVVGALLGYFFLPEMQGAGPYLLTLAAAGFLYVALADLVPARRGKTTLGLAIVDLGLVALGIGVIALVAHGH